jgi:hypothetical protein
MRRDVAKVLTFMGHMPERDFDAFQDAPDSVRLKWYALAPQPDDKAIDAAALDMAAAEQAKAVEKQESDTARDDAKRALAALDTIITGIDGATLTQAKTAIRQLAQIQRHIILATLGR